MKCPRCLAPNFSKVIETKAQEDDVLRRRYCPHCNQTFVTREVPDLTAKLTKNRAPKESEKQFKVRVTNNDVFGVWK